MSLINDFFNGLNKLPECIIDNIYEYIPKIYLVFTNKHHYQSYHYLIKSHILLYETYIRTMVRQDYDFVFKYIINENKKKWKNFKQYQYKNIIYKNYEYFIMNYCIENDANKCKELVRKLIIEESVCKNEHKNNVSIFIHGKTKHQ
jgi:hypothetical protein